MPDLIRHPACPGRSGTRLRAGVTGGEGGASVASVTELKLETFLPYRLSVVSHRVSAENAAAFVRLLALKIPDWRWFVDIAEGRPYTQQAVGVASRSDKVSASRAAQADVERGLL